MTDAPATPLADTLNASLQVVLDGLKAGVDFAKEEIPLLLKEKLAYDFYASGAEILFALLVLAILVTAFNKVKVFDRERGAWESHTNKEPGGSIILAIASIVWTIWTLATLYMDLGVMIKIYVAPRLYLMEWLLAQVRK